MNLSGFQLIEQTNALYRKTTSTLLLTSITIYSLVLITLWFHYKPVFLLSWYFLGIALLLIRHKTKSAFSKTKMTLDNYKSWLNKLLVYSFLLGLNWGAILMLSVSPEHFLDLFVLTTIYCALTSTSSSYLGIYLPAYFAFALPTTLLFVVKLFFIGGNTYFIFAGLIALYFLFITSLAKKTHAAEKQASALTYQNNSLYEKVVAQKEVAENSVLAKNQFLSAASHDLRQPLHAQGLFISALQYSNLPDKAQQLAEKIKLSNNALNSLLNGLLDISRLDSNTFENIPQELEVKPLLTQIYQQYFDCAAENESELILDIHDKLYIHCDENLFSRLIRNLVDNAIKFTFNGKVTIRTEVNDNTLLLSIIDTGQGIPIEEQKNIFNEFTQLNNPERDRQKGMGLGLAIVKRLVNLMSITLDLNSTVGRGTTFTLTMPISKHHQGLPKLNEKQDQEINKLFKSLVIAVIDDEADIRSGMRLTIERWQSTVITASNTKKAIADLDHQGLQPDFIISDFRLRDGENGIDAINELRKEFNTPIKAVLITGDTSSERIELAKKNKIPLLFKPLDSNKLRRVINEILREEKED